MASKLNYWGSKADVPLSCFSEVQFGNTTLCACPSGPPWESSDFSHPAQGSASSWCERPSRSSTLPDLVCVTVWVHVFLCVCFFFTLLEKEGAGSLECELFLFLLWVHFVLPVKTLRVDTTYKSKILQNYKIWISKVAGVIRIMILVSLPKFKERLKNELRRSDSLPYSWSLYWLQRSVMRRTCALTQPKKKQTKTRLDGHSVIWLFFKFISVPAEVGQAS